MERATMTVASLSSIISKAQSAQIHYTFNHQLTNLALICNAKIS